MSSSFLRAEAAATHWEAPWVFLLPHPLNDPSQAHTTGLPNTPKASARLAWGAESPSIRSLEALPVDRTCEWPQRLSRRGANTFSCGAQGAGKWTPQNCGQKLGKLPLLSGGPIVRGCLGVPNGEESSSFQTHQTHTPRWLGRMRFVPTYSGLLTGIELRTSEPPGLSRPEWIDTQGHRVGQS